MAFASAAASSASAAARQSLRWDAGAATATLVVASLPLAVAVRDALADVCVVRGSSMEPTLRDGDVLLVRKCERGVIPDALLGGDDGGSTDGSGTDRARLVRHEHLAQGAHAPPIGRLYDSPPLALPGDVVVYKDSAAYPVQLSVKRVVGVGGQIVKRVPSTPTSGSPRSGSAVVAVPPYSLYVEGDNLSNSLDSRQTGPVSKGLLVGVAEAVVWPPSRWQRLRRLREAPGGEPPRARWP